MKIVSKIVALVRGSGVVAWVKGELDKSLTSAADAAARVYGDAAVQLCRDVDTSLSNPAKLFSVATDLIALIAKDGKAAPFAVAVIVAERAYAQIRQDAKTETGAFVATMKG